MSDFQIFAGIDNGRMEPQRRFECMGNKSATKQEAKEAFQYEEAVAQLSADRIRKSISLELRDITNNQVLAHKRFLPCDVSEIVN